MKKQHNQIKRVAMGRRYPLIVEGVEGNYGGYFPDLPGCTTAGRTIEEISGNAKEALLLYLEEYAANGKPLPEASEAVRMEMIEIDRAEIEEFARAAERDDKADATRAKLQEQVNDFRAMKSQHSEIPIETKIPESRKKTEHTKEPSPPKN